MPPGPPADVGEVAVAKWSEAGLLPRSVLKLVLVAVERALGLVPRKGGVAARASRKGRLNLLVHAADRSCVMVRTHTAVRVLLAATLLAAAAQVAQAEIVEWRTSDGRTGFADRSGVPAGARVVGERELGPPSRPEVCDLDVNTAWARLRLALIGATRDAWRRPGGRPVALCARTSGGRMYDAVLRDCATGGEAWRDAEQRAVEAAAARCRALER